MPARTCPKSKFTPTEDSLLVEAVETHGPSDWALIATLVPGRNARQCRERWHNYANPHLTREVWTEADDRLLLQKYAELGPKWHIISRFFQGRGKNAIRNRFVVLQRRIHREGVQERLHEPESPRVTGDIAEIAVAPAAEPKTQDLLAFLDAGFQNCPITWQTEWERDGAAHYYFF
jgi:hypothetical protein